MKKITVIRATLMATVLCAAPMSLQLSDKSLSLSLDKAEARIGRPLTPGSIAGVHRRTERRAGVYYGHGYYGGSGHYAHYGTSQAAASLTCKEAAKLQFPTERKTRRAYKQECKQAWKAQKSPHA